jgi:hypothetical protein
MNTKLAQHVSFSDFCKSATIQRLHNHGRVATVTYNDEDMGFVDSMGESGLRQAHRRQVNNALWFHSNEDIGVPRPPLPTAEAIAEYPELIRKFPLAASILGFYVERTCNGTLTARACLPTEEERKTLGYALGAYGYLVERNERVSLLEFADRISRHYDCNDARSQQVIEALRSSAGISMCISR